MSYNAGVAPEQKGENIMISVIYGAKGSGKTKRIIDATNAASEKASGQVIFITDNGDSLAVKAGVRFVNLAEYGIKSVDEFAGFLKGMLATNFDIQHVFIDGVSRLLDLPADGLKPAFDAMEKVAGNVEFVVAVSADKLPKYLEKFASK